MFELTVTKDMLLTPLLCVSSAIDKKQSRPILANILLRIQQGILYLSATDLEIEIVAMIPCESAQMYYETTLSARKLIEILRQLEDTTPLLLQFTDKQLILKVARSQFKLGTLSAQDYPRNHEEPNDIELSLLRTNLINLLQSTHFAMAQQDVRVYLNSLLLEWESHSVSAVATDGHRMAISRMNTPLQLSPHRILLPRKGVQEMLRLLQTATDESILLCAGKNHIKLKMQNYVFMSKLAEARFPPYHKAIPTDQDKHIYLDRDVLKRSLTRIVIMANEKSKAILLKITPEQLTFIANNQEKEEAIESLEAKIEGQSLNIGLNGQYLLDVLNYMEPGEIHASFSTGDRSILIESQNNPHYQYIIMPMEL
jgi:DNA polymerase-3 subunit beta